MLLGGKADGAAATRAQPALPAVDERVEHEREELVRQLERCTFGAGPGFTVQLRQCIEQGRTGKVAEAEELRRQRRIGRTIENAVVDAADYIPLVLICSWGRCQQRGAGDVQIDIARIGRIIELQAADEIAVDGQAGERPGQARRRSQDLINGTAVMAELRRHDTVPLPPSVADPTTAVLELLPAPGATLIA